MDSIINPAAVNNTFSQKITDLLLKRPVILQLLKFGAIGVLNTALDFLILNILTKTFSITEGYQLGQINMIGFAAAVIQSYFWNKSWAFGSMAASLWQNFYRLVLIGALGGLVMALVLLGAKVGALSVYYIGLAGVFLVAQVVLWKAFGLTQNTLAASSESEKKIFGLGSKFWTFLVVSVIGLLINSGLLAFVSSQWQLTDSADLNKNIAKIVATFASLVWNFIGYKLFVFKK